MIKDILAAAGRKSKMYSISESVSVKLVEMSYAYQIAWAKKDFSKENAGELYIELIQECCEELKEATKEELRAISPSHIRGMGEAILELSGSKKD